MFSFALPNSSIVGSPPILALLVGRVLTTQGPCSNRNTLQQHGAILRFEYHRKQQRKKFPKARCCEP
jgi:hypothetical protein